MDPWISRPPRPYPLAHRLGQLPARVQPSARVQGQVLRVRDIPAAAGVRPGALAVSLIGAVAAGIHGYLRNRNAGWAAAWALGGFVCPAVTITFALSQGFGKRAR